MTRQEVNKLMINWMMQFTDEFNNKILKHYDEITQDKAFILLLTKWSNSMESYKHFKEMELRDAINSAEEGKDYKQIHVYYPSEYSTTMQTIVNEWEKF